MKRYLQIATLMAITLLLILIGDQKISVTGTTYYVAPSGLDSNPGTLALPFRTITKGVSVLAPGATLYVRAGTYPESITKIPSGTSWSAPVRIKNYPSETVWMRPSGTTRVLEFSMTRGYIEFDGINLDASRCNNGIVRIESSPSGDPHHIRIRNAELIGVPKASHGVYVGKSISNPVGGHEFINLKVHGIGGDDFNHAFYIKVSGTLVDGCDIYGYPGAALHIYHNPTEGFPHPNNVIVRNCMIHDSTAGAVGQRSWGIVSYGNGHKFYNNVIYNIRNSGRAGIWVAAGNNTLIYNNTIVSNANHYGIRIASGSGAIVRNNIAVNNGAGQYSNSGSSTTASTNLGPVSATGWLKDSPTFVNASARNYRLADGSRGIDQGNTIALVTTDKAGTARPEGAAYDIGAYER
jgi:parallel beta-helix repeat protein